MHERLIKHVNKEYDNLIYVFNQYSYSQYSYAYSVNM